MSTTFECKCGGNAPQEPGMDVCTVCQHEQDLHDLHESRLSAMNGGKARTAIDPHSELARSGYTMKERLA